MCGCVFACVCVCVCVYQAAAYWRTSLAKLWSTVLTSWGSTRRTCGSASPRGSCSQQQGAPKEQLSSKVRHSSEAALRLINAATLEPRVRGHNGSMCRAHTMHMKTIAERQCWDFCYWYFHLSHCSIARTTSWSYSTILIGRTLAVTICTDQFLVSDRLVTCPIHAGQWRR